ncbi:DNA-binding GntR family transcriptional regulator [Advenella incenata]|uniref:DNA-binding GntR family transcriptional regulator n=2 Tax=Advenella incenata TaxID=267800 RepID=A0A4Q7VQ30_9BURK|nr:DNA-binding GntR family transcriptional regulator [Advenella incenata]
MFTLTMTDYKISPSTMANQVANQLKKMIIEGALVPEQRLNERELCEQLNVSRTPLREAYRILQADGLIQIKPQKGAVVIKKTNEDIENIFELLAVLEGLAIRQAVANASAEEIAGIVKMHQEVEERFQKNDVSGYFEKSIGCHIAINRAAHNPFLTEIYDKLNLQVQAIRYKTNLDSNEILQSVREHASFIQALQERDAELAERRICEHMRRKKNTNMPD